MDFKGRTLTSIGAMIILAGVTLFVISRVFAPAPIDTRQRATESTNQGSQEAPIPAGEKAANFKLSDLSGNPVSLASLKGKVVFLNVWATWCGPCREEMPSMETLYDEMKSHKDFVMLAVSQDVRGKSVVLPYVQKNRYHFDVLLDPENQVGEAYNVSGVPETFIIDRDGRIVAHHMGAFDWSRPDVRDALQQLLEAKQG